MTLRLGSVGAEVVSLQTFLNITADGQFGPKTEAAVKQWQSENGLVPDGIVGPKTQNAMGLLTTDTKDREDAGELSIIQYHLKPGEYYAGPVNKDWIFLHHTAGWHNAKSCVDGWNADTRGAVGTEFILGGQSIRGNDNSCDGDLIQAFPKGGYAWHLGTGNDEMHRNSVGIEVSCFGQLTRGGYWKWNGSKNVWVALKPDKFYTYVGVEAHESQIAELEKPFRGFQYWHRYSDKQIEILKKWILWVAERDNIDPTKGLVELIKQKGAHDAFDTCDAAMCRQKKGLWSHTNVIAGKVDMFPQPELVEMLLSL